MNSLLLVLSLSLLAADPNPPKVNDDRLEISLFASEPQVTTPTGIAVDDKGIVFVIENNTHQRPKEYHRPEKDRILRMQDTDGDGRADKIDEFYTGLRNTMSIAFETDGAMLVATRADIFRLRDKDGDGKADERIDLIKLDTKGDYPHNGLAGFALDFRGNIYFGFGENLGADYVLRGTDNTELKGGAEGGNIYSCDPAGKKLRHIATGFWNPFHVTFDTYGRLFTVDNDPDSRPPCRLLHVVEGGDYGFRFRNGRKGVSPFTAWNGELPATLGMVAGTGEAPCAVMAYESDNLPDEYRGELLVTSWGDHRLERYTLQPSGATFKATMKPVVTGDQNFRPVGLAMAPDGSLFMSDWVDKSYPVHGKGRIWHLRAKNPKKREPLSDDPAIALAHPHRPWREAAARKAVAEDLLPLFTDNPEKYSDRTLSLAAQTLFAISDLGKSIDAPNRDENLFGVFSEGATSHELADLFETMGRFQPKQFAQMYSALIGSRKKLENNSYGIIQKTLTRRHLDLFWGVGKLRLEKMPKELVRSLLATQFPYDWEYLDSDNFKQDPWLNLAFHRSFGINHPDRIRGQMMRLRQRLKLGETESPEVWAANELPALESIASEFWRRPEFAVWELAELQRMNEPGMRPLIVMMLQAPEPDVRFIGIRWIAEAGIKGNPERLTELLEVEATNSRNFGAALLALDRISGRNHENTSEYFAAKFLIGQSKSVPAKIMALRMVSPNHADLSAKFLIELSKHEDKTLQREAVRALRLRGGKDELARLREIVNDANADEQLRCEAVLAMSSDDAADNQLLSELAAQRKYAQLADEAQRLLAKVEVRHTIDPKDQTAWQKLVAGDGNATVGERLFFHPKIASCSKCHEYKGRGGRIGPDLTTIAKSMTRERLLQSIVDPSREIAPQFTPWVIQAQDGTVKTGVYVGEEVDGTVRYADTDGKVFKLHPRDVEDKKASEKSIMPEGLAATLTAQELRDLLAFLLQP